MLIYSEGRSAWVWILFNPVCGQKSLLINASGLDNKQLKFASGHRSKNRQSKDKESVNEERNVSSLADTSGFRANNTPLT